MKNYLDSLDSLDQKTLKMIKRVGREADEQGLKVYLVGGVVRDIILKRRNHDLDIVVEGDAVKFARKISSLLKGDLNVHRQFKTAVLKMHNGEYIDFATARKEVYRKSGALPQVKMGSLEDDLYRRDFTINTLAVAINKNEFGRLIDLYGGLKDLKTGKVRILYEKSFEDDPTRILRAVRFEQRFDFQIERKTLLRLKAALRQKKENNVKVLRYFAEFKNNLSEKRVYGQLRRLKNLHALNFLDPQLKVGLKAFKVLDKNISLKRGKQQQWMYYMLGLLERQPKAVRISITDKLQLSREIKKAILQIDSLKDIINSLSRKNIMPSAVYILLSAQTEVLVQYLFYRSENKLIRSRVDQYLRKTRFVEPQLNGNELIKIGISSGRIIGKILEEIKRKKIDSKIRSAKQELQIAEKYLKAG